MGLALEENRILRQRECRRLDGDEQQEKEGPGGDGKTRSEMEPGQVTTRGAFHTQWKTTFDIFINDHKKEKKKCIEGFWW